jgi:hypothetical protein
LLRLGLWRPLKALAFDWEIKALRYRRAKAAAAKARLARELVANGQPASRDLLKATNEEIADINNRLRELGVER